MKLVEELLNSQAIPFKLSKLVELQTQLRIWHWQTTSHAEHEAFGKTYESLSDLIDDFIEAFQGIYGRVSFGGHTMTLLDKFDVSVQDYLRVNIDFLKGMSDDVTDTDLLNIRDEMLQSINKLLYLLTLA